MSRTGTWLLYTAGVFAGRLLPGPFPMTFASAEIAVTGAALVLLLHWSFNRKWKRWWPRQPRGVQ
jgi:hypothetical protein